MLGADPLRTARHQHQVENLLDEVLGDRLEVVWEGGVMTNLWIDHVEASPVLTAAEHEAAAAIMRLYNGDQIDVPFERDNMILMRCGRALAALPVTMHRHDNECGRA